MKKLLPLMFALLAPGLPAFCQKYAVCVKFTHTIPYCGGARPTAEVLAQAEKKHPYSKRMIIAVSDKKIDSARTGKDGTWSKKLPAGRYQFFEAWKYYHGGPGGKPVSLFSADCLLPEWKKPAGEVEVKGKTKTAVNIEEVCDHSLPCWKEKPHMPE